MMTDAERERCERIEGALRSALFAITAGGEKSIGSEVRFYDPIIVTRNVEEWQAALAPVEEQR